MFLDIQTRTTGLILLTVFLHGFAFFAGEYFYLLRNLLRRADILVLNRS